MNAVLQEQPLPRIDEALLQQTHDAAKRSRRTVIEELVNATGADARGLMQSVGMLLQIPVIETAQMLGMDPAFDLIPLVKAMQRNCVLMRDSSLQMCAVIADPFNPTLATWIESVAGAPVSYLLAIQPDIQAYLSKQEESVKALDQLGNSGHAGKRDQKAATVLTFATVNESQSAAVKLVNSTLYDALKAGASDIHLESTPAGLAVKYRVDGVLDHVTSVDGIDLAEQVISRIKVLAELDIAERRIPQDGKFRVEAADRDIDLRVSIMPSIHGEDAVVRVLDKRAVIEAYGALTLEALGFDAFSLRQLRKLAEEPHGMLLVTGPTGSGKTTTLYAALTETHNGRDKIITIEDPVEYQLPGILQIPVNDKKGLTFAKGLRSILRHDPDKIMVGEIRDAETAEIAVQSALTGHLVLSTLHANNSFDVFGRFTHMGVDPYAFVSALNGIWAQRLIRTNCPHCSTPVKATQQELERLDLTGEDTSGFHMRRGQGCGDCRGTGYKGRKAIAEILALTDELREMIVEKRPIRVIKEAAYNNGTRSLRRAALDLARAGETTLEEVKRVTVHA